MSAKYTVVQYVPDPTADERMNLGVIAWDSERVHTKFITNWRRLQLFGGADIKFLRNFAQKVADLTSNQLPWPEVTGDQAIDPKRLEKMIGEWSYNIQFTTPRGSLKDPQALLNDVAPMFLRAAVPQNKRGRNRRTAASLAHRSVLKAVQIQRPGEADHLVHANSNVKGKFDEHKIDVTLANGKLLGAVHAMSFEITQSEHLSRELDATAWIIDDLRKEYKKLPLAVYALPPTGREVAPIYTRATRVFKGLNAELVTSEKKMQSWAKYLVSR